MGRSDWDEDGGINAEGDAKEAWAVGRAGWAAKKTQSRTEVTRLKWLWLQQKEVAGMVSKTGEWMRSEVMNKEQHKGRASLLLETGRTRDAAVLDKHGGAGCRVMRMRGDGERARE